MTTTDPSAFGQGHLLDFIDDLDSSEADLLREQIGRVDFELMRELADQSDEAVDWGAMAERAEPPWAVRLGDAHPEFSQEDAQKAGEQALRDGKVAVILVAGGQGTRLGFDKPKGMFKIGPLSGRTLFQFHCDRLLAVMKRYNVSIPLLIMTSPATDAPTRRYFAENDRCGLSESQLRIFCQGTMPSIDAQTGKILLASKGALAVSPDGHGGVVAALDKGGCLHQAANEGIEVFFYAQVDNPLAKLCDPELIGYHLLAGSQMTTQVVKKRYAMERVGNVVSVDGRLHTIEYSDLPQVAAETTNPDGSLKFWAGSIAIHVFDRRFLEDAVSNKQSLPFHRAHKKVPHVDSTGQLFEPTEPNAIKFEKFVFDLMPLAKRAIVVEGEPAEVFAPVKNADGAEFDTPAQSKAAILALHRSWLAAAGAKLSEDIQVEIHPSWALDQREVASKTPANLKFEADTFLR